MASRILNTLDTFAVNVDGELETENISELYKPCPFLVAMSRLQTVPPFKDYSSSSHMQPCVHFML